MLRRLISASATCAAIILALTSLPLRAAPPRGSESAPRKHASSGSAPDAEPDPEPDPEAKLRVERGIEAWRIGDWTEVRDLLEPLVREEDIADAFLNESALRYLAEATLLDEGLDPDERDALARGYVARLLDSPDWTPPSGLHGRPFYDLVAQVRSERDAQQAEACRGQLLACEADLTELQVDYRAAQEKIAALQEDLANEDVFITEVVKRNRGLALIPFGVGHFTNGNYALGGTFLGLEVIVGAAGIGMLIYRATAYGCVRTDGFNRKSLVCTAPVPTEDVPERQDDIERLRNAEAVMGYAFIGALVLDIALGQFLFKPIEVVEKGKKTRRELDAELDESTPTSEGPRARGPKPPTPAAEPSVRLRIRPHPTLLPAGGGLGLSLDF